MDTGTADYSIIMVVILVIHIWKQYPKMLISHIHKTLKHLRFKSQLYCMFPHYAQTQRYACLVILKLALSNPQRTGAQSRIPLPSSASKQCHIPPPCIWPSTKGFRFAAFELRLKFKRRQLTNSQNYCGQDAHQGLDCETCLKQL